MRLLRDNLDIRDGLCSTSEIIQDVEQSKYQWEEKFVEKTKEEEECYQELITYRKELVDREWRSSDGVSAGVWRPRGQMDVPDTMSPDSVFSGYSKQIIPDHQLPSVHYDGHYIYGSAQCSVQTTLKVYFFIAIGGNKSMLFLNMMF